MSRRPKPEGLAPRKAAKQERATKTVEAVLEAGARILETWGFEGYTTNAIAERAGVSIGSLYQYFPNKDAITLALIEREAELLLADVTAAAAIANWEEALDRMIKAAVSHQLRRPVLARLLDIEEARLPAGDETAPASGKIYSAVLSVIAQALRAEDDAIEQATADVIGITRGMTDMAGKIGEGDAGVLAARVRRAVFGYLE